MTCQICGQAGLQTPYEARIHEEHMHAAVYNVDTNVDAVLAAHGTGSLVCCPRPTCLYLAVLEQSHLPSL